MEKGDWTTGSFRPKTIDDMALYPELKDILLMYAEYGMYEHLVMVGGFGVGKTTAARILADSNNFTLMEIACNVDNTATFMNKLIKQTTSTTLFGKPRLIIMDEFHNIKKPVQQLLKKHLEDRKDNNRFIFVVNDYAAVDDSIKSRTAKLIFDIGIVSEVDNKFKVFKKNTNMNLEGWKQELKRIAKLVSNRAGKEATDELIDKVLSNNDYIKDTRSFLIALQMYYNIHQMKDKT